MKEKPLITIAITCFNAEKTIERALMSALNQDWSNCEILVVDDASKDSSKRILKEHELQNNNLKFFTNLKTKVVPHQETYLFPKPKESLLLFLMTMISVDLIV